MITSKQLLRILGRDASGLWPDRLNHAMEEYEITTPKRVAAFLAQVIHESGELSKLEENLNYSAEGLLKTFPKYFDVDSANEYARNPRKIASRVYANRMGNGDEASEDGWLYRGRGLIQLTGKDNYEACGKSLGIDLLKDPSALRGGSIAALSAGWFWSTNNCNTLADRGATSALTRKINGGLNGVEKRIALYEKILKILEEKDESWAGIL